MAIAVERLLEYTLEAWASLRSRTLRSLLAISGVVIAVSSVIALHAVGEGARAAVIAELTERRARLLDVYAGELIATGKGRTVPLTDLDVRAIERAVPGVTVVPVQVFRAAFRYGRHSGFWNVTGISAAGATITGIRVVDGAFFTPQAEARGDAVMALGYDLASSLFNPPAAAIGARIHLGGRPFRVVATVKEGTDLFGTVATNTQVYIPLPQSARLSDSREYRWLTVQVHDKEELGTVEQRVVTLLQQLHPGANYRTGRVDDAVAEVNRIFDLLTRVLMITTGVSLAVGGIGVTNVMLMSVTERTREIGVRRALGGRRTDILLQFLIEACLLCLVGGLVGLLVAVGLVNLVADRWLHIHLGMSPISAGLALGIAFLMGIACGCVPAWRAALVPPAEALRSE